MPGRMFKKAVQRGRSERGGEAYSVRYVEPPSDARTKLADFFNSLQIRQAHQEQTPRADEFILSLVKRSGLSARDERRS